MFDIGGLLRALVFPMLGICFISQKDALSSACRKISVWLKVIRDENIILCVVHSTACEVTYFSVRHEVPGYNDMVEAKEASDFIYEDN